MGDPGSHRRGRTHARLLGEVGSWSPLPPQSKILTSTSGRHARAPCPSAYRGPPAGATTSSSSPAACATLTTPPAILPAPSQIFETPRPLQALSGHFVDQIRPHLHARLHFDRFQAHLIPIDSPFSYSYLSSSSPFFLQLRFFLKFDQTDFKFLTKITN